MARLLYKLGSTAHRRWPFFIAGWLLLVVVVGAIAGVASKPFNDEFTIPGIPSEKAADIQKELFPDSGDAFDDATVNVVVAAPKGHTLAEKPYADAIADLVTEIPGLPQMDADALQPGLVDPTTAADALEKQYVDGAKAAGGDVAQAKEDAAAISPLSADGRIGTLSFEWDVDTVADLKATSVEALEDLLHETTADTGLVAEANGQGMTVQEAPGGTAELIGLGIALVVLLLSFGSLVAAGMPLVNAVFGVGLSMAGVSAMTAFMDLSSSTTALSSMIGLAVGIDYTLFILARYRTELHHTDDRRHAAGIAVGTAGSAVVFAGLTVLIALSALSVVGIPFLTSMGLAAAATVLIAVLVALTLLPALLGMTKSWTFRGRHVPVPGLRWMRIRQYSPKRDQDGLVVNNGVRWARVLAKAPVAWVLGVVVLLGALAVPISQMYLAFPSDSTAASDTTQRKAADLAEEAFGPGRQGPFAVVVDGRGITGDEQRTEAFDRVVDWAAGQDDVANAQLVATNAPRDDKGVPNGPATGAIIQIIPASGPDDPKTLDLLEALREGQSAIEDETGTTVGVTGLTAITTDVSDQLNGALPVYLAVVIGLAFILLMLVFRSILIPLTATLGFLLSVLATLGATVAIFQEGAFGIFEGQPIVSFIPIFVIGVVFGLAMDYQVFLVTRMREAHVHGLSTHEAVVDGFRNSARVVTAAAAIMIAVFSGFILEDDAIIKSMGFALALAIVFDAFIVRMVLIPSLLYILGEKAWWLPGWLDRILPNVDVEGASLERDSIPGAVTRTDDVDDLDDDLDQDRELAGV
ncbi:RND superfamily putative drug exporter [Nocardioides aromaticivorans]|uniref:RND superfamily putative drug exporter n=1 Tax=Nocardioides aromaticivorans TaxID=200618 RepID=A0A7Y9ZIN1_9ACTN|nr:MMPL family transporter [Nocardioides aromaticivorans]NYI45093.1 RND superfamily putative drug exporter [Nocardioides aromaticivorans]